MGLSKSSSKREAYSDKIQHQETNKQTKTLNRQPKFISKEEGKRRTKKP